MLDLQMKFTAVSAIANTKLARNSSRSIFQKMRDDISRKCCCSFYEEILYGCIWNYCGIPHIHIYRKYSAAFTLSPKYFIRIIIIRSLLNWPGYLTINLSLENYISLARCNWENCHFFYCFFFFSLAFVARVWKL